MECPSCKAVNPTANRFCGSCGAGLPEDDRIPEYPARTASVRREIAVVVAGLLLICAAVGLAWWVLYHRNAPASIVRAFIEADRNNDLSSEQQYILSRWDSRFILTAMQAFRKQTGASPFKQYRILDSRINDDTAVVNVEVTMQPAGVGIRGGGMSTYIVPFVLVRQDRDWWIDATQTAAGFAGLWMANGLQQIMPPTGGGGTGPLPGMPGMGPLTTPNSTPGIGMPAPSNPGAGGITIRQL